MTGHRPRVEPSRGRSRWRSCIARRRRYCSLWLLSTSAPWYIRPAPSCAPAVFLVLVRGQLGRVFLVSGHCRSSVFVCHSDVTQNRASFVAMADRIHVGACSWAKRGINTWLRRNQVRSRNGATGPLKLGTRGNKTSCILLRDGDATSTS
ncbi:hypothetical protein BGZ61DRAFT_207564 [Ilyonectria robusta]|uniref:uncharacterized protein n=1 Tax=Ilyonectria robusta TaxID=1079257 RepID=UPI001E8CFDCB|nr:uncharacterized protein BGZ61DRAFT_207564 [Ilyonectria robusta]KAH8714188.1 hypothetical protein BGZ61DRAFT_207564 [Ilyonectria robusta]